MELPNPDQGNKRPEHGGRDRHFCVGIGEGAMPELVATLDREGMKGTLYICGHLRRFRVDVVPSLHSGPHWQALRCFRELACDFASKLCECVQALSGTAQQCTASGRSVDSD